MNLYENKKYLEDIEYVAKLPLPWDRLREKKLLLSGSTGLIGSFFVDVLLYQNERNALECGIYALGRDEKKARERFGKYWDGGALRFIPHDINEPLVQREIGKVDYVLHLASNTHPIQYSLDPIGTITTNIIGLQNMLDFAIEHRANRFAFASSNEIYGENRGDTEFFNEDYCGYVNSNTVRAGYPESKRCGEALCQAYQAQKGLDVVIPRLTRTYGPTMQMSDTKAVSQFIKKSIAGEDIVLKSEGTQYYSYTYVGDAVSGLLTVLLYGESGKAYNIAEEHSDIRLKDLAGIAAKAAGKNVVFELPDAAEAAGYSKATKARLDGNRLKRLGWEPRYDITQGVLRTIEILRQTGEGTVK